LSAQAHRDAETVLAQPAQNVFLDTEIIGNNAVVHRWKRMADNFLSASLATVDRAQLVVRIPLIRSGVVTSRT
jgi:hypothetical protein